MRTTQLLFSGLKLLTLHVWVHMRSFHSYSFTFSTSSIIIIIIGTFLIDLLSVTFRQSVDLLLELLLLGLGLLLQVGLVWAHRQGQSVRVLLQGGGGGDEHRLAFNANIKLEVLSYITQHLQSVHVHYRKEDIVLLYINQIINCSSVINVNLSRLTHLEVVLHFVLQEARVFLQGFSELVHAVIDLQQLHRVAAVVP